MHSSKIKIIPAVGRVKKIHLGLVLSMVAALITTAALAATSTRELPPSPIDTRKAPLTVRDFSEQLSQARRFKAQGRLSDALDLYARLWAAGKSHQDPVWLELVNEAAGEYLVLMSGVGRVDAMKAILRDYEAGRSRLGANELIGRAERSVWMMEHHPGDSYKCGVYALAKVGRSLGLITGTEDRTARHPSPESGFSLSELRSIGKEWGLDNITPVHRVDTAASLVYPSIAHIKAGHFVALLGEKDGQVRVADTTLALGKGEVWLDRIHFEQELDGYFAVVGDAPSGYRRVSHAEASEIRGTGLVDVPPDHNQNNEPQTACASGACGYISIGLVSANARVSDPLFTTTTTYGQPITVEVGDDLPSPLFAASHPDEEPKGLRNWSHNWFKYIWRDTEANGDPWTLVANSYRWRLLPTGVLYGTTATKICERYEVQGNGAITAGECDDGTWEISYPNGDVEGYGGSIGVATHLSGDDVVSTPIWPLKTVAYAKGSRLALRYGPVNTPNESYEHLVTSIEEDGVTEVSFRYDTSVDNIMLTDICDRYERCAEISYAPYTTYGTSYVKTTKDIEGVLTTYDYASSGDLDGKVNRVTTPHGISELFVDEANAEGNKVLQIDYYNNDADKTYITSERVIYVTQDTPYVDSSEPLAPTGLSGQITNDFLAKRNTLHIKPENMVAAFDDDGDGRFEASEGDAQVCDSQAGHCFEGNGRVDFAETQILDQRQLRHAHIYHAAHGWAEGATPDSEEHKLRSTQIESVRIPSPEDGANPDGIRLWLTYQGTNASYESELPKPTGEYVVAADGTIYGTARTYNARGSVLSETDRAGRTVAYQYMGDGVRVLSASIGEKVLWRRTYNDPDAPMLPDTVMDAAGYTTTFDYDAFHRLLSSKDPYGNTVKYIRDSGNEGRLTAIETDQIELVNKRRTKLKQQFKYDGYGRLRSIYSNSGMDPYIQLTYEGVGAHVSLVSWYNANGTQLERTQQFVWLADDGRIMMDPLSRCLKKDDGDQLVELGEESACSRYQYDAFRRVGASTDASRAITKFSYVGKGKSVRQLRSADNTELTYSYNARALLTEVGFSNGGDTRNVFTYDRLGQLVSRGYQNGATVKYGYTRGGELDWLDYSDIADLGVSCDGGAACDIDYEWSDQYPRLMSVVDAHGSVRMDYLADDPFAKTSETRTLTAALGGGSIREEFGDDRLGRTNYYRVDGRYRSGDSKSSKILYMYNAKDLDPLNRVTKTDNEFIGSSLYD